MTRFFISDTHFFHLNILKYANRPFNDINHMNEVLVNNWNSVVSAEDTVYHLGDFALGDKSRWDSVTSRLLGRKVLITGNHDAVFMGNKENYRDKYRHLYESFDEVHHNKRGVWLDDGTIVDLSHYPYDGDSHDGDRYTDYRLEDRGRVLIHGHTHREYHGTDQNERYRMATSRSKRGSIQVHVGVDNHHYRPVTEDEVIDMINLVRGK